MAIQQFNKGLLLKVTELDVYRLCGLDADNLFWKKKFFWCSTVTQGQVSWLYMPSVCEAIIILRKERIVQQQKST